MKNKKKAVEAEKEELKNEETPVEKVADGAEGNEQVEVNYEEELAKQKDAYLRPNLTTIKNVRLVNVQNGLRCLRRI